MSITDTKEEKTINDFTNDVIEKTKLFFKSFNELTKENLNTYLECIDLLDIWNTKDEKEFLWKCFYKYNINGKVIQSSVLKGLNEILSRDEAKNYSVIISEEKNEDYSTNGLSLIKLSYNKKRSSIIKSSNNSFSEFNEDNISIKKSIDNLSLFIDNCDKNELKQIKNINIILDYNYLNGISKNNHLIKLSQIIDILAKYPSLKITRSQLINYLSLISENSSSENKNSNNIINDEFIINIDLFKISHKLLENKIEKSEKESIYNEEFFKNSNNDIFSSIIEDNKNDLENKLKIAINSVLDIDGEFKGYIQIFKEIEKSLKNINQDIIDNFKLLLSLKNEAKNSNNLNINKVIDKDKDNDEDEIKINIENNIFYIKNKSNELDIFIEESEKIIRKKELLNKYLNELINKLIQKKVDLEKEQKELILKNKESENEADKKFNFVDEKINQLSKEKIILENKINELLKEIEKNKLLYKNNQSLLKELDEMYNAKINELEEKDKEIKFLKQENKKKKEDYNSLLNELIKINKNKEINLKEYENKIILNAKNNIEKKMKLDETQTKLCYLNHEQLLEYTIILNEKIKSKEKKLEEINQLLNEKNIKIKQLECDLDLYREKTCELSNEIKMLKNNKIKENDLNSKKNQFTLDELGISRSSIYYDENKIYKKTISNEFTIFNNKETPRTSNNLENNLFAPPCLMDDDNKLLTNDENTIKDNESKNINNFDNLISNKDNDKLFSNEVISETNKDNSEKNENGNKEFSNTPKEEIKNNISIKKEENLIDIFKNIIDNRPSNPYRDNNNNKLNELNESNVERESNPYKNNNERESNPYNNNNKSQSNLYNNNDNYSSSNENLNINEIIKINDSFKNINDRENNGKNNDNFISQSNIIINNNLPIYIDKSLSMKEMNEIFEKNHENKLNIEYFDYLHLYNNEIFKEILLKIGDYCNNNEIFSDIVYLLDEYEQIYKYILFITRKCIYIIECNSYKIKYTFVRNILLRFTISNNNCNIIVFHFTKGNDLVIMTLRRPELIYYFIKIKENNEKSELKFKYADEFNVKKDGRYYTQKIKSSMNSMAFNFQTAIKIGYLTKINEGYIFNQFHDKLVALTDFGLFYFDNPTIAPKKLIPIIGSDIIQLNSKFNEKQFVFEIKTLNKNKIVFGTDDKVEYDDWLRVFNEMKQKYEKKEMKI